MAQVRGRKLGRSVKHAGTRQPAKHRSLSTPDRRVLHALSDRVDLDIAQISSRSLIKPSEVRSVLRRLESKGLIRAIKVESFDEPRYLRGTQV